MTSSNRALKTTLLRISHELIESSESGKGRATHLGIVGPALFLARMATQNWVQPALRETLARAAVAELRFVWQANAATRASSFLYAGLPGFFWSLFDVAEVLRVPCEALLEEIGCTPEEFMGWNRFFLDQAREADWKGRHELIAGLSGLGFYALRMLRWTGAPIFRELARQCVRQLDATSQRPHRLQRTWYTPAALVPRPPADPAPAEGYYNLGLSHGIPGALAFLSECVRERVEVARVVPMVRGVLRWLETVPAPTPECRYPASWRPGEPVVPVRLSWCYGDAGASAAILSAAIAVKDRKLRRQALELFERSLVALRPEQGVFGDANLCHGRSGVAFFALWFSRFEARAAFAKRARIWCEETLAWQKPDRFALGAYPSVYRRAPGRDALERDHSLLTGSAGVGLVLLASLRPAQPESWSWEGLLGLSRTR